MDSNWKALLYTLCALGGAGTMLNVALLLWQCFKVKIEHKGFQFVKLSMLAMSAAHGLVGIAVVCLILYSDMGGPALCKAGGFLILFSSQESLWILLTTCVSLWFWKRNRLSKDLQRRNVPIFGLIFFSECLVIAIISFLPLTDVQFFDASKEYYFLCTPLRLPGEEGWAFSTLTLILNWIAVTLAIGALIFISVRYSSCREAQEQGPAAKVLPGSERPAKYLQHQLCITLSVCAAGWATVLALVTIAYFSSDHIDKYNVDWIIGFGICATVMVPPLTTFIYNAAGCGRLLGRDDSHVKQLLATIPRTLEHVEKTTPLPQDVGIVKYGTSWVSREGIPTSGILKLYSPCTQNKWRNEVNALAKLGALTHPNVARYLWVSPDNQFASTIHSLTADVVSKHASLTCRLDYTHGTLHEYLQRRVQTLSEISLHKITLDIAQGLEFLHQRDLVHNGLSTHAVYMASVSEKIGLKVVIGDFENSYVVPSSSWAGLKKKKKKKSSTHRPPWVDSTSGDLFSISRQLHLAGTRGNNWFTPDIRSFGLIVLEMLVAMSQHKERRRPVSQKTSVSGSFDDVRMMCGSVDNIPETVDEQEEDESYVQPAVHSHSGDHQCSCSSKVTDVRAHVTGSRRDHHKLFPVQGPEVDRTQEGSLLRDTYYSCNDYKDDSVLDSSSMYKYMVHKGGKGPLAVSERFNSSSDVEKGQDNSSDGGKPPLPPKPKGLRPLHSLPFQRPVLILEGMETSESDTDPLGMDYKSLQSSSGRRGSSSKILTNGSLNTPRNTPVSYNGTPVIRSDASTGTATDTEEPVQFTDSPAEGSKTPNEEEEEVFSSSEVEQETSSSYSTSHLRKIAPIPFYTAPANFGSQGFTTIYEEEETSTSQDNNNSQDKVKGETYEKSRPRRPVPLKRKIPGLAGEEKNLVQADYLRKKRMSTVSLDESVISMDSGMGSSHYETFSGSEASGPSAFHLYNIPGNRDTIYSGSTASSEADSYSLFKYYLHKPRHKVQDSGIESNADSCDELARWDTSTEWDEMSQVNRAEQAYEDAPEGKNSSFGDMDDQSLYEKLPDMIPEKSDLLLRKGKQPCTRAHEHMHDGGANCCHAPVKKDSSTNTNPRSSKKKERHSVSTDTQTDNKRSSLRGAKTDTGYELIGALTEANQSERQSGRERNLIDKSTNTSPPATQREHSSRDRTRSSSSQTDSSNSKANTFRIVPRGLFYEEEGGREVGDNLHLGGKSYSEGLLDAGLTRSVLESGTKFLPQLASTSCQDKQQYKRRIAAELPHIHSSSRHIHKKKPSSAASPTSVYTASLDSISLATSNMSEAGFSGRRWPSDLTLQSDYSSHAETAAAAGRSRHQHRHHHQHRQRHLGTISGTGSSISGADGTQVKNVLDLLKRDGQLGFIGGQLLPLLADCWTEDNVPSADSILARLGEVLPTARV